jgi:hypothetical protein
MVYAITGQTVKLHERTYDGEDPFGAPLFTETIKDVENVLISPTSDEDIVSELQMYGKHSVYTLSIPKGDNNNWEDSVIEFFGKTWRSFGPTRQYQEELVPLSWNKKVKVELYE